MAKIYEYSRRPRAAELEAHRPVKAVLKDAEEIQKHLLAQDQAISDIVGRLEKMMSHEETTVSTSEPG